MNQIDRSEIQKLRKRVALYREDSVSYLAGNGAATIEDYKYIAGAIQAYDQMLHLIDDLPKIPDSEDGADF